MLLVKEKLVNLCRTHEQIKLVKEKIVKEKLAVCAELSFQENVFSCTHEQLKLVKENCWKRLVHRTHKQGKLPRNLSRKTCSSVWGSRPLGIRPRAVFKTLCIVFPYLDLAPGKLHIYIPAEDVLAKSSGKTSSVVCDSLNIADTGLSL